MSFSDYLEKKLLDHVFGGTAYSAPATLYLGLSTADPGDDGAALAEPSGGGYARVAVTNNTTNFPDATGTTPTTKATGAAIPFAGASGSWGLITHFVWFDAVSGGNILASGALTASQSVEPGDVPTFNAGALTLTLD